MTKDTKDEHEDGAGLAAGGNDTGSSPTETASEVETMVAVLKGACDRNWSDETPIQIATIAANGIYWRDREIETLRKREPLANFSRSDIDDLFEILRYTHREPHRISGILRMLAAPSLATEVSSPPAASSAQKEHPQISSHPTLPEPLSKKEPLDEERE